MSGRIEIGAMAIAGVMAGAAVLAVFPPPSWWLELNSLTVRDSKAGQPAHIVYDRTIHRDFKGRWQVDIRKSERGLWVSWCTTPLWDQPYKAGAPLPENRTLEWLAWTEVRCYDLPPGTYQATVHIEVNPGGFWTRDAMVTSPPFEVR